MSRYLDFFSYIHSGPYYSESSRYEYAGSFLEIPESVVSILDLGCGSGWFLNDLSKDYYKVGVDFCMLPLSRVDAPVAVAGLRNLPFRKNSFDLVTSFEVLEHLSFDDFSDAIEEMSRVSEKYIAISVPNCENLQQALVSCEQCYCSYNPSWHVRSFDKLSLMSLINGFTMIECNPCGPMIESHDSLLVKLYRSIKPRVPHPLCVCPQCGYYNEEKNKMLLVDEIHNRSFLRRIIEKIFLRYEKKRYWLLAIYRNDKYYD